jgi:PAS domain S-box-containing protein
MTRRSEGERAELSAQLIAETSDLAIILLDPDGLVESWNRGAERTRGFAASEILGVHFSRLFTDEDRAAGEPERVLKKARDKGRCEHEAWRLRKDGTRFWASVVIQSLRDEKGGLRGYSEVTRDFANRGHGEALVRTARESIRLTLGGSGDALLATDRRGDVTILTPVAEALLGWSSADAVGKPVEQVLRMADEATRSPFECPIRRVLREAVASPVCQALLVGRDGSERPIAAAASPIHDDETLVGAILLLRDRTGERRAEHERATRLSIEEANRTKDEFLAVLGHELRNPLSPILTALQLLRLRATGPLPRELEIIERQVKHVARVVDDLLDVSRITQGRIKIQRHPVDVGRTVVSAAEAASFLFEERQQHFELVPSERPLIIRGDDSRLVQVFSNLFTNAARYSERGGHIRVDIREEGEDAVVVVKDDGIGIPADLLPHVFEPFRQGERTAHRSQGSLGLGLSIVRALVQLHGGGVMAQSQGNGRGSTFTVRLPLLQQEVEPVSLPSLEVPSAGRRQRLLVVDDNEDALYMVAEILVQAGHDVRTATDPPSALEVAKTFPPDVAILDIGLPVMDGYELGLRLREAAQGRPPRLIALTGYGQEKDFARSRTEGFDEHFVKPVSIDRLLKAIDRLVDAK